PDGSILVAATAAFNWGAVLRVDPDTGAQSVVAIGADQPGFFSVPFGVAVAPNGDIFVVDAQKVVRVDPATGAQSLVSQGGLLAAPYGVAVAGDGTLLVTDAGSTPPAVLRIDPRTGAQSPIS